MGGVPGQGDPLNDQTDWVLDRIVELFPGASAGFDPAIAVQTILEAIETLRGTSGTTLFGLAYRPIDASKVEQMLALLREALDAWRAWSEAHDPVFAPVVAQALSRTEPRRLT